MTLTIQSDHSQLPLANAEDWKVAGRQPVGNARPVTAAPAAEIAGQVGGSSSHGAPPLDGRATPTAAALPRDPLGNAVLRNSNTLTSILNRVERTRGPDGTLSPRAQGVLQQLGRIADTCDVITGGLAVGETLIEQMNTLTDLARGSPDMPSVLTSGMEALRTIEAGPKDAELDQALEQVAAWTEEVAALAHDRINYLAQSLDSSALSVSKHFETRANMNDAAVAVLEDVIKNHQGDPKSLESLQKGKATFEARRDRMKQVAQERCNQVGRPEEFGGARKLGKLGALLNPFKARAERNAREKCVSEIVAGRGGVDVETRGTNEMSVVEDALARILKQAKVTGHDAEREVKHAFLEIIDANPQWTRPIKREIHLPVLPAESGRTHGETAAKLIKEGLYSQSADLERVADLQPAPETSPFAVQTLIVNSEITPAPALLPTSYDGKGVNAHRSAEEIHPTNLAQTRLSDSQGNVLFNGVRHGALSAYGITQKGVQEMPDHELQHIMKSLLKDDEWRYRNDQYPDIEATMKAVRQNPALVDKMRARANKNRATEAVVLAVMSNPAVRTTALNKQTPQVDLLSLSLVTPDSFRRGKDDNETLMLRDQAEAWKSVSGPQTIEIPDDRGEPVRVQIVVNPVAMNYGVNQGAVKGVAGIHTNAVSGWDVSDTLNDDALHKLFGDDLSKIATARTGLLGGRIKALEDQHRNELAQARQDLNRVTINIANRRFSESLPAALTKQAELEAKVQRLEAVPADQSTPLGAALELARQIADIHREGAHRNAGNEPYKMPTRLAVLADLLGVNVAFNCKSGKDRTGELDAEIKHFKLQMMTTGKVPHYERERSPDEIRQFHEVLTNSGNFEMQQLNTGFAGYKLKGVGALYRQFGGDGKDDLTRNFHGLSDLVST